MKLRPPSSHSNREFVDNMGSGIFTLFGVKNPGAPKFFIWFFSYLIGIGAIGAKLILRKRLGVRAVNIIMLALHIFLSWAILVDVLFSPIPTNIISDFYEKFPYVTYYFFALIALTIIHFLNIRFFHASLSSHTGHRGYGILNYILNRYDDDDDYSEAYLRMAEAVILAIGSYFFLTQDQGKFLTFILWISCACLIIEETIIVYVSWQREMDMIDHEKESKWLSQKLNQYLNKNNGSIGNAEETSYRARTKKK